MRAWPGSVWRRTTGRGSWVAVTLMKIAPAAASVMATSAVMATGFPPLSTRARNVPAMLGLPGRVWCKSRGGIGASSLLRAAAQPVSQSGAWGLQP
jgi:hypothetical protein